MLLHLFIRNKNFIFLSIPPDQHVFVTLNIEYWIFLAEWLGTYNRTDRNPLLGNETIKLYDCLMRLKVERRFNCSCLKIASLQISVVFRSNSGHLIYLLSPLLYFREIYFHSIINFNYNFDILVHYFFISLTWFSTYFTHLKTFFISLPNRLLI